MNPAPAAVMESLKHVRKSAADTVAHCDSVLVGRRMNAAFSLSKLPAALRLLIARAQQALDALDREGNP